MVAVAQPIVNTVSSFTIVTLSDLSPQLTDIPITEEEKVHSSAWLNSNNI